MKIKNVTWRHGEPSSIEEIQHIEKELKIKFPKNLVKIFLEHNGGLCSPSSFTTKNGKIGYIGQLFKLDDIADMVEELKSNDVYIEKTYPIFWSGSIGIVLDYRKSNDNPAIAWIEAKYDDLNQMINPIADNFDSFLESLHDI